MIARLGQLSLFISEITRTLLRCPFLIKRILAVTLDITLTALPTVLFSGAFVGAILVLQFNEVLSQYDALTFLGGLNTSALIREVGPLIISFLLAGKVGAFIAAELGTMRVTDQIDAMDCLGTNSVEYLVVPRFFGIIGASQFLLAFGLLSGFVGSLLIGIYFCDLNALQFAESIPKFVGTSTLISGFIRSALYGFIVAAVSCFEGYYASNGSRGVGIAVTRTAIYTNLYIVIANALSSQWIRLLSGDMR